MKRHKTDHGQIMEGHEFFLANDAELRAVFEMFEEYDLEEAHQYGLAFELKSHRDVLLLERKPIPKSLITAGFYTSSVSLIGRDGVEKQFFIRHSQIKGKWNTIFDWGIIRQDIKLALFGAS